MKKIKKEIKSHKLVYILLFLTLAFALFLRVWRVDKVLGFYFDQGRDALVVWDFWHQGKLFLIGPTTGIAGIFRGPYYYYLIAPFYLIGNGNPVFPSVFLAITTVLSIYILYVLGKLAGSRASGLIAAILAACSFYIVLAGRWLSNPTPMLFLSMALVFALFKILDGKKNYWMVVSLVSGLSLSSFGSAGEVFYFPAILIFAIWQRKNLPTKKIFLISSFLFFLTVAPQLLFDLKHHGILSENVKKFLVDDKSFKVNFWDVANQRLNFYYDVFTSKIFHWRRVREITLLRIVGLAFLIFLPQFLKNKKIKTLLILLITPMVGLLFFQGNFGNIYDYYLTGYYQIFILLFAIILGRVWQYKIGKIFIIYFFYVFLTVSLDVLRYKLSDNLDGPETIEFGNEREAVDWVYKDAKGIPFSTDVYVPPVIPYAYTYLFAWMGNSVYGYVPSNDQIDPLYTIYEVDPPSPDRLEAWLKRQKGIGKVEKEVHFGGITVQKRTRIQAK
ncbi:glycosyltransferase family 39 protein [Candidatus Woesebacteria bacterium]|nr:glycosyltransferase family 39 protein [Candidatus Woesebacteria bacterium]QQG47024.1 MAG: glycosyltransferase family 39 protein [Candidatus Woesebacteria bacterium]